MILLTPTDRAEAALLGRILLDEEDRAHGRRHGPRLLEQVRRWGITQEAIADPLQPHEAEAGLAEHVKRDHAEQRVERAVDRLRTLGTEPTTGPEDLITSAETVLGEAYVPETERDEEPEQEEPGVPTARVSEEELTAAEETELNRHEREVA